MFCLVLKTLIVLSDERFQLFAAECHLLTLQRLQNRLLRPIRNFPRRTSVRDMHKAFQIPYVYDYIAKS
jgi:hypothetical protein